ncbi:TetR/AcrR family transcriptional regulator [Alicyclobacillus sp. SO9]|uniref:TetR/AcrR family transcriptional regulator n=1 Tax=Alicyclobacillus sp. SO9 TaxID=2665646 RepID=UPI0018E71AC6|nr:TetR/AcrR family transcriptional regulator [Alicyclobacillus sp. SO9]QQE77634.1 TetR/AcrR family transcriptional regulator [Alicyclobacillus sp. SO9]
MITLAPKVTEEHKRQRRADIIAAAKTVFYRIGYLKTTMQDVIDEVGLSRGAVYDYFGNKSELFRAVVDAQDVSVFKLYDDILQARPIWPALVENILDPFERYNENAPLEIGAHIEFVLETRDDNERLTWVVERYQRFVTSFTEIFQTGISIGEFAPLLPADVIARFTLSAMDGIHMGVMAAGVNVIEAAAQTGALRKFLLDNLRPLQAE